MIKVRSHPGGSVEQMDLDEFERRARAGDIAPRHEVCFPAVTGNEFVVAGDLELFRGLYAAGAITFKRYFHLGRIPWLTVTLIGVLCATYFSWQGGEPASTEQLLRQGAKSRTLIIELGQWWRLLSANLLHVSGWHLLVNAIFLLNLGGPTEAIFRRLDYVLVLCAAALGTTLLSAAVDPQVSCGASGVVFGVWGAAAVFGVRHRGILPDRYRRYFIGSVIPYSIFALYLGFAMEGIDNWGHLGGLLAGSVTAFFLPARLLQPRDPWASAKILVLAVVALVLTVGSYLPAGVGALSILRYYPRHGLLVPIPSRWDMSVSRRNPKRETFAFENAVGVAVALEARFGAHPATLERVVRRFVETDLAEELELAAVEGVRISEPSATRIAGLPARRIRAELLTEHGTARADFHLFVRGNYQYVVSFSSPLWLAGAYGPAFARIAADIRLKDPDELETARRAHKEDPGSATASRLAVALAHVGDAGAATEVLAATYAQWPDSGEPAAAEARLLWERRREPRRACALGRLAMERSTWTAALLALAVDLHRACDEEETARRILRAGLQRFPEDAQLHRREAAWGSAP